MPDVLPIKAERITLRRMLPADLAALQAYRHDAEVGRYQDWTPQSDDEVHEFLLKMSTAIFPVPEHWFQVGIALVSDNSLVGDIGICMSADMAEAEIGFTLRAESQGMGLGSEAVRLVIAMLFESLNVNTIVAITDTRNEASSRLLESVGMSLSRTVESVFRGLPCEEHVYEISREK